MSFTGAITAGRRLIDSTLTDLALPKRRGVVSDGAGGQTETFTPDAQAVACRFGSIVDPNPIEQASGVFGVPTAQAFFSLASPVGLREGDRIVNQANNSEWVVVGNKTAASTFAVVDRLLIREV